jgi:hypothetical protein
MAVACFGRAGANSSMGTAAHGHQGSRCAGAIIEQCSGRVEIPEFTLKFYYTKRRFSITSKYRHIYGVLNIDEIIN